MAVWALQDAKAKFSEVVDRALTEGPQHITRHGRPVVVITAEPNIPVVPKMTFAQFLLTMPRGGPDDMFDRPDATGRDIEF